MLICLGSYALPQWFSFKIVASDSELVWLCDCVAVWLCEAECMLLLCMVYARSFPRDNVSMTKYCIYYEQWSLLLLYSSFEFRALTGGGVTTHGYRRTSSTSLNVSVNGEGTLEHWSI